MPICGIAIADQGRPIEDRELEAMGRSLCLTPNSSVAHDGRSHARLGSVSESERTDIFCGESLVVACDADLLNAHELSQAVLPADQFANAARLLAQLYLQKGDSFVHQLRGAFSIAVW